VHEEVVAPWFDAYRRWNEKWAVRVRPYVDFENEKANRVRLSVFRFSPDHAWEVGVSYRQDGDDLGFFVNFDPSVGGRPLDHPFHPQEDVDYLP
jgi:hypothetical protein